MPHRLEKRFSVGIKINELYKKRIIICDHIDDAKIRKRYDTGFFMTDGRDKRATIRDMIKKKEGAIIFCMRWRYNKI